MTFVQPKTQQLPVVVDQFTITISNCELEIEVDSVKDGDFSELFRVWKGDRLIGTYHECSDSDGWKSLPVDAINFLTCGSEEEAQEKIIESYLNNRLV